MELGWPYPKRVELLEKLAADTTHHKTTWPIEFQGRMQNLAVERVPIGMPKYSLRNGRTSTAQKTYLAKHKTLRRDLFTYDPESDVAQQAQHEILKGMLGDKGLLGYFKKNPQKVPLFLTSIGRVLNGNRRLCAMRVLYVEDPEKYAHFAMVDIVVLPASDDRSLSDLEFNLQIKEDIQADYSWTAEAEMFRQRLHEIGYSEEEIAQRAGKTEAYVKQLFDMLDYADVYLKKRKTPDEYDLVDGKEYAFRKLVDDRRRLEGEEKDLFQELAFAIIDEPQGGRAYQTIQDISKFIGPIRVELVSRLGVITPESSGDELDELLGGRPAELGPLIEKVADRNNGDVVRNTLIEVVEAHKQLAAEKKRNDFVLSQVRKANTALNEAFLAAADGMNKAGVSEQLEAIESVVPKLKAWASNASKP